jgi:uncharacterized protein involved in exopolysaccharide biosynthesis
MTTTSAGGEETGATLLIRDALRAVVRNRRDFLVLFSVAVVVGLALVLMKPRTYTVVTSFTPGARRTTGSIGNVAAQLGIAVPLEQGVQSPQFYTDLARSRTILRQLARAQYTWTRDGREASGTYVQFLGPSTPDSGVAEDAAVRVLEKLVVVTSAPRTGVVTIRISTESPVISLQLAQTILALLEKFNVETRRSQATAEKEFTKRRSEEVLVEVRESESRVQQFLLGNRDIRNSPSLSFELDRRQRELALRQQIYAALVSSYEQARVEEVRDTPQLTIVERPVAPPRSDPRGGRQIMMVSSFLGALLGLGVAIGRDRLARGDGAGWVSLARELRGELVGRGRNTSGSAGA